MSRAAVARVAGLSDSYLSERLMLRKSFTLSDIEALGRALHFEPSDFLAGIDTDIQPTPASHHDVGAIGDHRHEERFAADRGDEAVTPEEAGD
ncbi:hypothetical protein GCM10027515_31160 [Schumannella luteola]|uniref:Transcriptional regulator with XRE-family HTH domain n=1 Tax=Schumannella luteola TaxID=472059 RepID=A0A852Y9H6_9MICO|nr:hypothetical protein [Schumannella luteola]NYG99083.1 transcriptional regulator with XRE-family HTH domain [Schumannella luteola]